MTDLALNMKSTFFDQMSKGDINDYMLHIVRLLIKYDLCVEYCIRYQRLELFFAKGYEIVVCTNAVFACQQSSQTFLFHFSNHFVNAYSVAKRIIEFANNSTIAKL